jgi:uncharacterized protein YgfB (UPF0149 family)
MTYNTCNTIITNIDPDLSAAEAHGMAAGMLCINEQVDSELWLTELLSNNDSISDENKYILIRLFEETRRLLFSEEFEFDLFLPEDDTSLDLRVLALKCWCRGFLFGLGSGASVANWSRDAIEILKDIAEFTKLDTDVESENDENDFVEITEYLRPAVLLLRDELTQSGNDISA